MIIFGQSAAKNVVLFFPLIKFNTKDRAKMSPALIVIRTAMQKTAASGQVLTVAWMNAEALRLTRQTREAHFWSRSRQCLWHKGATSGNVLHVVALHADCDGDTLLLRVNPSGPACHTGRPSCFFQELQIGQELR